MTEQCPSLLIVRAIAVLASCLLVAGMAAAGPQAARGAPVLAHRVAIPAEFLTPRSPDKPDQKFGGDVRFGSFEDLASAFGREVVHPMDLKNSVAAHISEILAPVRSYLEKHPENHRKVMQIVGGN